MRLVLDTNVLIAAFISEGVCHELLEHCFLKHEVVLSNRILKELDETLQEKFKFSNQESDQTLELIRSRAILVEPKPLPKEVCRDSDDDWVLATGTAGGCQAIVSGDKTSLSSGSLRE